MVQNPERASRSRAQERVLCACYHVLFYAKFVMPICMVCTSYVDGETNIFFDLGSCAPCKHAIDPCLRAQWFLYQSA